MKLPRLLHFHFAEDRLLEETKNILHNRECILVSEIFVCKTFRLKPEAFKNQDIILVSFEETNFAQTKKLLSEIFSLKNNLPVIVYSNTQNQAAVTELLAIGVSDFILSPIKQKEFIELVQCWIGKGSQPKSSIQRIKESLGLRNIIGKSEYFLREITKLPIFAQCDACVLVVGETGTGKEMIARSIHYLSQRSNKAFVPINCGAIPTELVENELFGHEKGAFTGASAYQKGLIQEADHGTLFLDEIDSLPLFSQVKLLRFLQDKEYRSLGSAKTHKADVRIISASNANLDELLETGKLRLDLFYRINVLQVNLPPLRQRLDDIGLLAEHFLEKYSTEFDKKVYQISDLAIQKLQAHIWRGNVRELENVIGRAVLLCENEIITDTDIKIGNSKREKFQDTFQTAKAKVIERFEKSYLQKVLSTYHGNISQAAKAAGKDRRAFFELIRKYQINVENFRLEK